MTKELDIHPAFLLMAHLPLFRHIQYNAESPEYRRKKKKELKKPLNFCLCFVFAPSTILFGIALLIHTSGKLPNVSYLRNSPVMSSQG